MIRFIFCHHRGFPDDKGKIDHHDPEEGCKYPQEFGQENRNLLIFQDHHYTQCNGEEAIKQDEILVGEIPFNVHQDNELENPHDDCPDSEEDKKQVQGLIAKDHDPQPDDEAEYGLKHQHPDTSVFLQVIDGNKKEAQSPQRYRQS